jgi:hypothetical protein
MRTTSITQIVTQISTALAASATTTPTTCGQINGSATVTKQHQGGTGSYGYLLEYSKHYTFEITNVSSGTYTVHKSR